MQRPIITICGSTRFEKEIIKARKTFTMLGYIVLSPEIFGHGSDAAIITDDMKRALDQIHKDKIELANIVYIVNPNGYIGESTKKEIEYAESLEKEIWYMEGLDDYN